MASKKINIRETYLDLAEMVSSSHDSWMEFLKFASHFQNYSFDVVLLIYGQNKDASAVATYDQWKKYGRHVKAHENGMSVGNLFDGSNRIYHLFDLKQTAGKEIEFRNWEPSIHVQQKLLDRWGYHQLKPSSFQEALYEEIENRTEGNYGEFQSFIQESVYEFCTLRMGKTLKGERDDLDALAKLTNARALSRAGNTIMNIARTLLNEVADVINQDNQEDKENERRELSRNESETSNENVARDPRFDPIQSGTARSNVSELSDGGSGQDTGSLGQVGRGVSETERSESLQLSDTDGENRDLSKHSGPTIPSSDRPTSGGAAENQSGTGNIGYSDGDATHESATGSSEGTGSAGSPGDTELRNKVIEQDEQLEGSTETQDPVEPSFFDEVDSTPGKNEAVDVDLFNYQEKLEKMTDPENESGKPSESVSSGNGDLFSLNRGYSSGAKAKFYDNLDAIQLLKSVEEQERVLTEEEQRTLGKYVGWGGLANAFNPNNEDWSTEYQLLKEALSEDEYRDARNSTLTSYYTDPQVISAIYGVLDRWGMNNGRLLDPAMGTGNFFSALPATMRQMERHGVEIDSLTGRIAERLYPNSNVYKKGFEDVPFQENSFDVVVGNIPFNDIRIMDPKYDKKGLLIHDYFFAKSIDVVKPGGIVAFITSRGTMDRQNSTIRKYINERAALIGSIRLPDNAFQKIAGTKVTTDILFLQKRLPGEDPEIGASWIKTVPYFVNEQIMVNEFYQENRFNILGSMKETSWIDGDTCVALPGRELIPDLKESFKNWNPYWSVQEPVLNDVMTRSAAEQTPEKMSLPEGTHLFTYFVSGDHVYFYSPDGIKPAPFKGVQEERLKHLCQVRGWLNQVIQLQMHEYKESDFQGALLVLNRVYDAFVHEHGFISLPSNRRLLDQDDQQQLLLSIEVQEGHGERYRKADIFERATIRPLTKRLQASSAQEALVLSLNEKLAVDLDYMRHLYRKSDPEIIKELGDSIFLDPAKLSEEIGENIPKDGWVTREEYLSGDVKTKLEVARDALEKWPNYFSRNIEALETVMPEDLTPSQIDYRVGSTWIPVETYQQFMYETFDTARHNQRPFGTTPANIRIDYNDYSGKWRVDGKNMEHDSLKVNQVFGTSRANAYELIESCLNLQDVTIRDTVTEMVNGEEKKRSVLNPKETILARQKQTLIQEHFKKWLFSNDNRANQMLKIYNDRFNRLVIRQYDGQSLEFSGMNAEMELRPHQKNVVARILSERRALMAHEVGAGKTAAMIAAGMYLKHVGAVEKPMYVVPNGIISQWAEAFYQFYPSANILITTEKDFEKNNRKQFVSRIATGSYDAVIIGHSQFERIPLSLERQQEVMQSQIDEISFAVEQAKREDGDQWSVKQMVRFQKNLEERLEKLNARSKKDDLLTFEQLGVDFMFVDEAHNYKNCFTFTKMKNVAGVSSSSSQRATDMLMKCDYLQEKNHGGGVVFATGTPVTNSMSEMYVMQRYLQPETLESMGLRHFDSWASTFGEVVSSLEITPEGSGYRMKSRFAKFHNLPELMTAFNQIADIQTADMLHLPTPKLEGGKAQVIVTDCTPLQRTIMDEFVERSERIRNGSVDPTEDNMLKLTHEARLMAIDPRLVRSDATDERGSKLNAVVNNVYSIWEKTLDKRSTQMIFCDSGTPNPKRFNAYDEIKSKLVARGVPENEIAFIHDAKNNRQRDLLFQKVRQGDVRVLLASTQKGGTGTNVQTKLIALHHVDCPWRPSDLTQRDGRGLRQGNENESISIFRYVTKGTFDSYLWQIQEQKLRYISQIMSGKSISRSCADMDETVLSAAEVKAVATDNPELLEKMSIDNEVARLRLARNEWQDNKLRMKQNIATTYPNRIAAYATEKKHYENDLKTVENQASSEFLITVGGKHYDARKEAGEAIDLLIRKAEMKNREVLEVGVFKGLKLFIEKGYLDDQMILKGQETYRASYSLGNGVGNMVKLDNKVLAIPDRIKDCTEGIEMSKKQLATAQTEVNRPFDFQDKLDEMVSKQTELNLKLEFKDAPKVNEEEQLYLAEGGRAPSISV